MDRTATHNWLTVVLADLLELAGIATEDTPTGLGFVLDQVDAVYAAHPGLSIAYANELAAWFALQRIHAALLSVGAKVTVDGDTFDLTRTLDGIDKWMHRLLARIAWLVEPVEEVQSEVGKVVTVHMPWTNSGMDGETW